LSGDSKAISKAPGVGAKTAQRVISAENESIVCLPNRVVVTVTNSKKEGMDGFAQ
jgi:Holliday junction resolvasome RuvABC DNA-binding subunit